MHQIKDEAALPRTLIRVLCNCFNYILSSSFRKISELFFAGLMLLQMVKMVISENALIHLHTATKVHHSLKKKVNIFAEKHSKEHQRQFVAYHATASACLLASRAYMPFLVRSSMWSPICMYK